MLNIVLFGPPGAGKGTQSQLLIDKYKLVHLSTGDILRAEKEAGTPLGKEAQEYADKGILVPDALVIAIIENKIKANKSSNGFIFDGFPRTVPQAEALDKMCTQNGIAISGMVALSVNDDELFKRIEIRGQTSGRADDQNHELIRKRISEYNEKTAPVANYYDKQGKFKAVEGIGSLDEVFGRVTSVVDSFKK